MHLRFAPTLAVLAAGLIGAGCHHGASDVYVDVSSAVVAGAPADSGPSAKGLIAIPASSAKFTLPASPAVTETRLASAGAAKVQTSIVANRERTFKLITRRLHDAFSREAANLRAQKLASFTPVRAEIVSKAMGDVSQAYIKYANAVGPKIARLAVNAGFPDPDPKGKRKPSGAEGLDTLAYNTSQKLRSEISVLQANFKRYSETTLRAADADADAKLTELLSEVARQVGEIDDRAQMVARREVSQAQAQLGPLLADRPPTPLPATPESSVVVSSGAQPAVPAQTGARQGILAGDDLARAKQDLDIWLAVNKYVQRPKGRARDATAEFIAWRHRFRQEPSALH